VQCQNEISPLLAKGGWWTQAIFSVCFKRWSSQGGGWLGGRVLLPSGACLAHGSAGVQLRGCVKQGVSPRVAMADIPLARCRLHFWGLKAKVKHDGLASDF